MMHPKTHASLLVLGIAGLLTVTGQAYASGYQISEQSVAGLGRAFAGGTLPNDDVSAVFYNTADMMLSKGMQAQAGFVFIGAELKAKNAGTTDRVPINLGDVRNGALPVFVTIPDPGYSDDGGTDSLVPNTFFAMDINDQMRFGFGITAPFAVHSSYGKQWVGRYSAVESDMKTIDLNPGIAYRVNDQLSLGFGVSAQYIDVTLSRSLFTGAILAGGSDGYAETKGDDWGFGFNLGATYEFDPTTRVGLSYRSQVKHNLEGDTTFSNTGTTRDGKQDVTADWTAPDWAALAFYKRLDNQWAVMASTRWTNWSTYKKLQIDAADGSGPLTTAIYNWEDSWSFNLGVSYDYGPDWTFRAGYVFDQSPIKDEYRVPSIPDSDRNAIALGFSYRPMANLSVDFGYMHIWFKSASTDETIDLISTNPGLAVQHLLLNYDNSADLIGLQASYKF